MKTRNVVCLILGLLVVAASNVQASVSVVSSASRSFRLDTRSVHEVDGSTVVNIAYSGNLWGTAGAGASADISAQMDGAASFSIASGLASSGVFSWWIPANGLYTISLSSGSLVWQETFSVSNVKRGFILIVE